MLELPLLLSTLPILAAFGVFDFVKVVLVQLPKAEWFSQPLK